MTVLVAGLDIKNVNFLSNKTPIGERTILCLSEYSHTLLEAQQRLLLLEGVSFPFSFQFFTRLAAVFAEDFYGSFVISRIVNLENS